MLGVDAAAAAAATGAATARRGEHCRWSITSSTELAHAVISVQKSSRAAEEPLMIAHAARHHRDDAERADERPRRADRREVVRDRRRAVRAPVDVHNERDAE